MDRTVAPELQDLALRCLSLSSVFEAERPRPNGVAALERMKALESLTRESFAPTPTPVVVAPIPVPRAETSQPVVSNYDSHRGEYRPALSNPGVVDALLEYHRSALRKPVASPPLPAPAAATEKPKAPPEPPRRSLRRPELDGLPFARVFNPK